MNLWIITQHYGWQVIGKNDTCTVPGSVWKFTTIQDPNLVIDSINVYPQNANYWTGTCSPSAKTQISLVNAVNTELGWMAFDVDSIPSDATILLGRI